MAGALSIAQFSGDWGHGVCGPWGCGPPTQALIACHLAWLVILTPPAVLLSRRTARPHRRLGMAFVLVALAALLAVILYQRATWWSSASQWQRPFFWQRCGFCIVTAIDLPIVQTLVVGVLLIAGPPRRARTRPGDEQLAEETGRGTLIRADRNSEATWLIGPELVKSTEKGCSQSDCGRASREV